MKNSENNKYPDAGSKVSDDANLSIDNRAISTKGTLVRRYGILVLISLVGLTISLATFFIVGKWEAERRKFDFDRLAEIRCSSFRHQITYYLHELAALKRFHDGSQFVNREEFNQFVSTVLGEHQDIRGFVWAPRVTESERIAFEQVLQAEGWANHLIHDSSAQGEIKISVHHNEYYPVLYRVPHLDWAIGINQLSISPRRKAIEQARDMNQLVVTGRTLFPGESKDRFGTIAFAPIYKKGLPITTIEERRAAIEGVVICAMRPLNIMQSIIGKQQSRGTDVRLNDLSAPKGEQFLFQYQARLRDSEKTDSQHNVENTSEISFVTSFDVANRKWEMRCTPSSGYMASHSIWIHWVLLLVGLILTFLCAVFSYIRTNRMAIIEEVVKDRTNKLQAREQQLKASNQQLMASEQHLKAGEQQLKATNQQLVASEQQLKATNLNLSERIKELNCLYGISHLLVSPAASIDSILQGACDHIRKSWHYPEMMCVRIVTVDNEYKTTNFKESQWSQGAEIKCRGKTIGQVEIHYLQSNADNDEGPFLKEDRLFIDALAERLGRITERKQAEEKLREERKRAQMYLDLAGVMFVATDNTGTVNLINPKACEVLEYAEKEIIGKNWFDTCLPQRLREEVKEVSRQILNGEIVSLEYYENPVLTKSGEERLIAWHNTILRDDKGSIIGHLSSGEDITETIRLQALESRAERLETAGTIAGQVAHDFNNLLAPIMAYPEFVHELLPHDHKAHSYLDAIENAAQKIANINQDLLTMGRRGHYNLEVLDLNRVVLHAIQEMESRTETVTCDMKLCEDIMKIKGGGAQIHRMLSNLLVNAQDAMQDIGQITIRTENYYADDTSVAFGRVPKGEYVKLTVSDNGCGIPEDIIQKILDPFFSTKTTDKKRGSGLGLSVVDAVMKDHDGYLDLSSKVGHGTSFYLYFPVTREDSEYTDSVRLMGGTETVLVVDDDNIQREVSTQLLTNLGYNVSSVESGEEAIEFLRENTQDLVILDMVMPSGIDGTETYRQILEISPHQKAIIISGFSESDRVLEVQKLGAGAFVKKPITKNIIAAAVRTELDRPVKETSS